MDGLQPDGLNADGSQRFRFCNEAIPSCRPELFSYFRELIEIHDQSLVSVTAPRIISFTVRVMYAMSPPPLYDDDDYDVLEELDYDYVYYSYVDYDFDSIRLLQPAVMDPDESVIDLAPYWQPAAKATASAKASSWGRIKATFADN